MKLISINVALVGNLFVEQSGYTHRIATGIHKKSVSGKVMVNRLGLAGDEQADLSTHGGLDKAVYAYPIEHYAFWKAQRLSALKRDVPVVAGSMGENLTLEGILESDVWIGDRFHIGGTVLQVTEPRPPCFKFAAKMGFSHALKMMMQSGYTGFYFRVIQIGSIQAGDTVTIVPGPREISINKVNEQRWKGRQRDLF